jgi:hypothetical protein
MYLPSISQVTAQDFLKEKEASLHNATLLGDLAKSSLTAFDCL